MVDAVASDNHSLHLHRAKFGWLRIISLYEIEFVADEFLHQLIKSALAPLVRDVIVQCALEEIRALHVRLMKVCPLPELVDVLLHKHFRNKELFQCCHHLCTAKTAQQIMN